MEMVESRSSERVDGGWKITQRVRNLLTGETKAVEGIRPDFTEFEMKIMTPEQIAEKKKSIEERVAALN